MLAQLCIVIIFSRENKAYPSSIASLLIPFLHEDAPNF